MKKRWTKKVPQKDGWYWIKYRGKHGGKTKCPCEVTHFKAAHFEDDLFIIKTARNDSFYSHSPKDWAEARFGPQLKIPPG
jgi:hypothetical protein